MLDSDFDKVMSDDNVNFSEISIDHEEFLHNYLKNLNLVQFLKYELMTLLSQIKSIPGYFQIRPAAGNFVSHEILKKLSEPIQWMTKPTSSPKKTFGTASSLQKRS